MARTESEHANVALVEKFWAALAARDFAAVGAFMSPRGHYIDVPLIGTEDGAFGPAETEARLASDWRPWPATTCTTGSSWRTGTSS